MEERISSSYVELNKTPKSLQTTRMSNASHLSRNRQSFLSQSQSHARSRVLSHSLKPYTDSDANESILRANAPPNYTGGFNGEIPCTKLFGV
ncbi:hypothetical protein DD238_007595 [Peronospora effusa]|uniref:Uncharacterized protein n=1 Tax=Peronospora effusa TaxID=542832 RepID=A0A3M6V7B2_9STRA|nr:hypothetical protein DD238_007595 [Peronospora effusa]RQM13315.1 hypothetical protein DD237_007274 [Peronospora effusa]